MDFSPVKCASTQTQCLDITLRNLFIGPLEGQDSKFITL